MTYFDAMKDLREMAEDHKKDMQKDMQNWQTKDVPEDTQLLGQICFKLDFISEMIALMIKQNDHLVGNTSRIEQNTKF